MSDVSHIDVSMCYLADPTEKLKILRRLRESTIGYVLVWTHCYVNVRPNV
jgi:hypothetical protein